MTLNDLIRKAHEMGMQLSSGDVSLYDKNYVEIRDIKFDFCTDNEGEHFIRMRVI